jgi:hypothetical protein
MWSVEAMQARSVSQLLVGVFDEVWARQRARMDGLTQEEYVWEPVPDCWGVTEHDGGWHVPQPERTDPVPPPSHHRRRCGTCVKTHGPTTRSGTAGLLCTGTRNGGVEDRRPDQAGRRSGGFEGR